MKLTSLSLALVAALTLACTSVQAQTNTMSSSTTTTSTSSMAKMNYGGTVTAVDTSANSISVHSKKHDLTLMVSNDTTYKGAKALSDIKVGDKVRGSYMKDAAGKMTAASVNKKM